MNKEGEPRKGDSNSNLQKTAGPILSANKPIDGEPLNRLHVTTYSLTFAPVEEQTGKNAKIKVEAEGDVWGNITSLERDVARRVISTHRARLGQRFELSRVAETKHSSETGEIALLKQEEKRVENRDGETVNGGKGCSIKPR